eukprot:8657158-Pyramimonas_sp.AAC.1
MEEWYSQAHDLLLGEGVTLEHIRDAVKGANLALRPRVCDVIKTLQDNNVPFLVFSAGIANVISEVLAQKFGKLKESTHIVSNWMYFDEHGNHRGFSEPLIHMFNKNESQTKAGNRSVTLAVDTLPPLDEGGCVLAVTVKRLLSNRKACVGVCEAHALALLLRQPFFN